MVNVSFMGLNPDQFTQGFEPILLETIPPNESTRLVIGLVKKHGSLRFVLRKHHVNWKKGVTLDSIRLTTGVKQLSRSRRLVLGIGKDEILRHVFEAFIEHSPFKTFVREHVTQWEVAQFFNKLRAVAPALLISLPRHGHDEQTTSNTRVQGIDH